jgi:hypothetical protein
MAPRRARQDRQDPPGGIVDSAAIREAGRLDALGLDGGHYLTSSDPAERVALQARAAVVEEHREVERHNFSVEIVNTIGEALDKN